MSSPGPARRAVHHLSRYLEGAAPWRFPLPLCWDAAQLPKPGETREGLDGLWWLSWDVGAVDPTELLFATAPAFVTCRECLEWLHA